MKNLSRRQVSASLAACALAARAVEARGAQLYTEPRRVPVAPYGTLDMFSVRSPEGAILEFHTRVTA